MKVQNYSLLNPPTNKDPINMVEASYAWCEYLRSIRNTRTFHRVEQIPRVCFIASSHRGMYSLRGWQRRSKRDQGKQRSQWRKRRNEAYSWEQENMQDMYECKQCQCLEGNKPSNGHLQLLFGVCGVGISGTRIWRRKRWRLGWSQPQVERQQQPGLQQQNMPRVLEPSTKSSQHQD